jgi:soluble lytic murein transglycosylase-like protein
MKTIDKEIRALKIICILLLFCIGGLSTLFIFEVKPQNKDQPEQPSVVIKEVTAMTVAKQCAPQVKTKEEVVAYVKSKYPNRKYITTIVNFIYKKANETGLPINVILTLIDTESQFKYTAVSNLGPENGRGITQVSEIGLKDYNSWHGTHYTYKDLYDPETNIEIGCWCFLQNEYYITNNKTHTLSFDHLYVAYNVGAYNFKNHK